MARWRFPTAPEIRVTANGGYPCTAWFDLDDLPVTRHTPDDKPGFDVSTKAVHAMIDAEIAGGVPSDRIVLGGFSQGGAMAITAGLRYPRQLGGIVCFSGWAPLRSEYPACVHPSNASTPILITHGSEDDKVDYQLGVDAFELLKKHQGQPASTAQAASAAAGAASTGGSSGIVRFESFRGYHEVPQRSFTWLESFLVEHLK